MTSLANKDSLVNLLDQRAARSDQHTRFPSQSMSISQFSDSPSVYSPNVFSPNSRHFPDDNAQSPHLRSSANSHHPFRTERERLEDPAVSSLDLESEPRYSFASHGYSDEEDDEVDDLRRAYQSTDDYEDDDRRRDRNNDNHYDDENDEREGQPEDESRMSVLGPKMRFHSPAPWEMEDDTMSAQDDASDTEQTTPHSYFSAGRGLKKGLGLASNSRSSEDSTRSQSRPKKPSETSSSQASLPRGGALHSLAQASLSSTSIVPPLTPTRALNKLTKVSSRTDISISAKSQHSSPYPSPRMIDNPHTPSRSNNSSNYIPSHLHHKSDPEHLTSTAFNDHSPSVWHRPQTSEDPYSVGSVYSHEEEDTHPYANPNLAVFTPDPRPAIGVNFLPVSRSDSSATITESPSSSSSGNTRPTLTPDTSSGSLSKLQQQHQKDRVISRARAATLHGREISSPVAMPLSGEQSSFFQNRPPLPLPQQSSMTTGGNGNDIPGWTKRSSSPTFTLISLEEARAQRSRSATAQPAISIGSPSMSSAILINEEDDEAEANASSGSKPRSRARSISAGIRSKKDAAAAKMLATMNTPMQQYPSKMDRRDSEPAVFVNQSANAASPGGGKTLKPKRSGFLRIFNGRDKDKDKDDKTSPPPVPALADAYVSANAAALQKPAVISTHRVPVPSLSPSAFDNQSSSSSPTSPTAANSSLFAQREGGRSEGRTSPRKTPPPLSLKTTRSDKKLRSGASPANSQLALPPQSAPAHLAEFPALRLRPVSTAFSSQFGDHILSGEEEEEGYSDTLSPSTARSPVTPGYVMRHEYLSSSAHGKDEDGHERSLSTSGLVSAHAGSKELDENDPSSIIRALREEIVSAKRSWQQQIWELEGQVRDLKTEVEDARALAANDREYCAACGRGKWKPAFEYVDEDTPPFSFSASPSSGPSVNLAKQRPRAKTSLSSRFGGDRN